MKRIVTPIVCLSVFAAAAHAQDGTFAAAEKLLASVEPTEAGLYSLLTEAEKADPKAPLAPATAEALFLAYGKAAKFSSDLSLSGGEASKAVTKAGYGRVSIADDARFLQLLRYPEPAVRAFAVSKALSQANAEGLTLGNLGAAITKAADKIGEAAGKAETGDLAGAAQAVKPGTQGSNDGLVKDVCEILKSEQDPGVLKAAVQVFGNSGAKFPCVGEFLIAAAGNANPAVRAHAGAWISSSWNKGMPGAVETVKALMLSDPDPDVRKRTASHAGGLADDALVEAYEKVLGDPAEAKLHGDFAVGLLTMWWDFPLFRNASEKAYLASMAYLRRTPRKGNVASSMISRMKQISSNERTMSEWKAKAPWYKPEEVTAELASIVLDKAAEMLQRNAAADALPAHGYTKEQMQKLLDDLKEADPKATAIKNLEAAIGKMK